MRCCRYWRNFNLRRMINLSEENVKELEAYIQEMPVKYGLPLLQYLQKLAQEQNTNEENGVQE